MFFKTMHVALILIPFIAALTFFSEIALSKMQGLPVVEVLKTTRFTANDMTHECNAELKQINTILLSRHSLNDKKNQALYAKLLQKIIAAIKRRGNFDFVNVSPIFYPNEKKVIVSITAADKNTLKSVFLPIPHETISDPDDLIKTWQRYEKIGFTILFEEKQPNLFTVCPAFHCLFGFEKKRIEKI